LLTKGGRTATARTQDVSSYIVNALHQVSTARTVIAIHAATTLRMSK
jgi:hypothetical protein